MEFTNANLQRIASLEAKSELVKAENKTPAYKEVYQDFNGRINATTIGSISYDGEKNLGEAGPIKNYALNYSKLRIRSWDAFLDSEVAQLTIRKFINWMIGGGLKLQCEPIKFVLQNEKIEGLSVEGFSKNVEAYFELYRGCTWSDFSNMQSLDMIAYECYKNAIIGGDVLVVLRFIDQKVKIQLIDGCHIKSPVYGSEQWPSQLPNGTELKEGIEIAVNGEHVAYWIETSCGKHERIEAKIKDSDLAGAFMVYGLKYRLNNVRGIPLIACVLETIKKMERYKEATLGSAEERAKIVYQIVHDIASDGRSPLAESLAVAMATGGQNEVPHDANGKALAKHIAYTTNKQTFNMTQGAELKALESKSEPNFSGFYTVNIDIVCAVLGIPPDIAKSSYASNYSASRAAIKDWEHTLLVGRKNFGFQMYRPVYNFFLEGMILLDKINAPGYMLAKLQRNGYVIEAYRKARWVGAQVPHIDPMKEVQAERAKLGLTGQSIPLTTVEQATENLGGGEALANMEQYATELQSAKDLKIYQEPKTSDGETEKKEEE